MQRYLGLVLRGMCMGAAEIVPGVSGGTMAFILGIYEELINSVRMVGEPAFLKAVFGLRIREALSLLNWQFLLAVASGTLIAILTLAHGLEWLLINRPIFLWSFLFGLVLASVFVVSKRIVRWTVPLAIALLVGAAGAFAIVGLVPGRTPESSWFLFLSGAVAICAMILPGISGAFILVLLGKYQFVLHALTERDVLPLLFVAAGAAIGLVTFAQILSWLFTRYHDLTVALLMGLMIGSLRKVWPWKEDVNWQRDSQGQFLLDEFGKRVVIEQVEVLPALATTDDLIQFAIAFALALAAFILIVLLDRYAIQKD